MPRLFPLATVRGELCHILKYHVHAYSESCIYCRTSIYLFYLLIYLLVCYSRQNKAYMVYVSLLHFHLSHMAAHHLHHLHYHRLHLLLLVQYFILNSRLGSSVNPFLHRPFPFLPD